MNVRLVHACATALKRPYGEAFADPPPKREDDEKQHASELNAPKLDEAGKPTVKAISDAKQACAIAKALKKSAIETDGRLALAGTVASLYNNTPPFPQKSLDNAGQNWRANFSSGFLSSIVDRVTPQLRDPIYRADVLTHANFSRKEVEGGVEKARAFREVTTRTIRGWKGWNDFISMLAQDVCLYGGATPGRTSRDWRPKLFRPDQCYLFEKSEQHASRLPLAVFWEPMALHDFLDIIRDKEAARVAGYNVDGCIKAVNLGGTQANNSERTPLEDQDAQREKGSLQHAAENQGRVVSLFHLIVREYDGKLALWTVSEEGGHEVRHIEDCEEELGIETMDDAISLFTLQVGNGRFYGSKGLGRLLANIHIAVERGRCLAIDQNYLAGLPILVVPNNADALTITVQHPFVIIKGAVTIDKQTISFEGEHWKTLDDMLTALAEGIAGAFIPPNLNTGGSSNTKIEAAQKAEREVAVRQGVLGRFFAQFADLVGMIKRAIYSAENIKEAVRIHGENQAKKEKGLKVLARKLVRFLKRILGNEVKAEEQAESIADQEAVQAIVELLECGLSVEEIAELRDAPDGNDVQGSNAERDQKTQEWIAANAANPFLNKRKATKLSGEIAVGKDRVDELINKEQHDPLDIAINQRQQVIEFGEMMGGEPMPVAVTDVHAIHRETLLPRLGKVMETITHSIKTNAPLAPEILLGAQICADHFGQHLQMDGDTPDEQKADHGVILEGWGAVIKQGIALVKKQQAEQAEQDAAVAAAQDPNRPKSPEELKVEADVMLKTRELDIKERDQQHKERMDVLNFTKDTIEKQADAQLEGVKSAEAQAEAEKARQDAKEEAEKSRIAEAQQQREANTPPSPAAGA